MELLSSKKNETTRRPKWKRHRGKINKGNPLANISVPGLTIGMAFIDENLFFKLFFIFFVLSYQLVSLQFTKPIKSRATRKRIMVCVKTECGTRTRNEDRHAYIPEFEKLIHPSWQRYGNLPNLSYFGVYDGHGGAEAAQWASDDLHNFIAKNIGRDLSDLSTPIMQGYSQFDAKFCHHATETKNSSGSCAVSVIIQGSTLYVANIGDCAAVICRGGKAILLSDEHPPSENAEEQKRVLTAGGSISCDGRLNGDLNVSRAFGDVCGFEDAGIGPRKMIGLSSNPIVKKHSLSPEDEFLIIACDGIFDFVNYKNSVQTVRRTLRSTNNVEKAAQKLIQYATKVKSTDNMTCMVVGFPKMDEDGEMRIVKPFKRTTPRKKQFIFRKLDDAMTK